MDLTWLLPLAALLSLGVLVWAASLVRRDTGIVDIVWGPFFAVLAGVGFAQGGGQPTRALAALVLTGAWALRLATHLAVRNLGAPEDRRYAAMRRRHGARWPLLSLPLVFVLQPLLACVVGLPLFAATRLGAAHPFGWLDALACVVVILGLGFETIADLELTAFKADPDNLHRVLDHGLWRYSRHPNYFGDFVVWWGFGLFGVSAGAPWSLLGPLLMSVLLLRVSGVTLLEKTIGSRRPEYAAYVQSTNAFFPGPPRRRAEAEAGHG